MYSLSPIQKASLQLLVAFDSYCREHDIRYWLTGGTLLGAVRHKGFVPWDDDIDVMMFRRDYDRLAKCFAVNPIAGTFWESAESNINNTTIHLHGKICVGETCFRSNENLKFRFGLDIFPLDYVWEGFFKRSRQYLASTFYKHLLPLLFGGTSGNYSYVKAVISFFLGPFFKNREEVVRRYREAVTGPASSSLLYSGSGRYGWCRETFPAMWFEETRYASFESSSFPVPNGAEAFLQRVYGDECLSLTTGFVKSSPHYRVDLRMVPKRKLTVTLVLATCGRISEVSKWLDSASRAAEDAGVDVQLIVADQNDDERLVPLLAGIPETWRLDYVKIAGKGVCLARNSVLHMIKGDIVAFPDDDCIYEIRSLREVFLHFKENIDTDVIVGVTESDKTGISTASGKINRYSAFWHGEMYLQFYRREVLNAIGEFDENFGPGEFSRYPHGGDDSDYLARAVLLGLSVKRCPLVNVWHPRADMNGDSGGKIFGYGVTRMALLKKLRYPFWFIVANVFYPVVMMVFNPRKYKYFFPMFYGRMVGFFGNSRFMT